MMQSVENPSIKLVICIGNSDDKLSQLQWSCLTSELAKRLPIYGKLVELVATLPTAAHQSAWYILEVQLSNEWRLYELFEYLQTSVYDYGQESIAVFEQANTYFLGTETPIRDIVSAFFDATPKMGVSTKLATKSS